MNKVYLAGPIFGRTDHDCKNWREEFIKFYPGSCHNPMLRDYRGKTEEHYRLIVESDKQDISDCDVLVAYIDQPSAGTSMEIHYAYVENKPVIVINATGNMVMSPWIKYHADKIVNSIEEAIECVLSI